MQYLALPALLLSLGLLAGCSPRALSMTAEHPASPDAPAGRLAGPPPALTPGAAEAPPAQPAQPTQQKQQPPPQPQTPHEGHEGHH